MNERLNIAAQIYARLCTEYPTRPVQFNIDQALYLADELIRREQQTRPTNPPAA